MTVVFHKPYGTLTKFTDPAGRSTLADFLHLPGMCPIGRLDQDSEGLLLISDEARLHQLLTTPGKHAKTYWVQLERVPEADRLEEFQTGVTIQGGYRTRPARIRLIPEPNVAPRVVPIRFRKSVPTSWAEITLWEGKNRQVRRMTAAIGHSTLRLIRCAVGPIKLRGLEPGRTRQLDPSERRWLDQL